GPGKHLVGRAQLDLRDHQPGVVAEELVDLPQVVFVTDIVAALVDQPADAQGQQCACVVDGDRVIELLPGVAEFARLQIEEGGVAGDAYAHRGLHRASVHGSEVVEVTLRHRYDLVRGGAP